MNNFKVFLLMSGLTMLMVFAGAAMGGQQGMVIAFLFALGMNFFGYWTSDKMAIKMTKSYPVTEAQAPELYEMVDRLSREAGIPMPRIYLTPSDQPNAFATGRNPNNAAVAVTEGLMRILNKEELEGVMAHEIAHIVNRDILIGTIAAVMAGTISMIANMAQWALIFGGGQDDERNPAQTAVVILMMILAPMAAMIVQMAISRSREYQADYTGAMLSKNPKGLANALLKLEASARRIPMKVDPSTAHMFIVSPLFGQKMAGLFSTHPPIQERVERLNTYR